MRGVHSSKIVNRKKKTKTRLIAKGCQEENNIKSDSLTCIKGRLHLILNITPTMQQPIQFIDIKSAFLQSYFIDREFFVKPPKGADESPNKVWKLNTTICGIADASRSWCVNIKNKLLSLGVFVSELDPSVFIWHNKDNLESVMCVHVDEILFG